MALSHRKHVVLAACESPPRRLGSYASTSTMPPGAMVAQRAMNIDPRTEPPYGARVPYVVVAKEPGARLVDGVRRSLGWQCTRSTVRLRLARRSTGAFAPSPPSPRAQALDPHQLVEQIGGSWRLDSTYYITKAIIPALERVLSLVRVDSASTGARARGSRHRTASTLSSRCCCRPATSRWCRWAPTCGRGSRPCLA